MSKEERIQELGWACMPMEAMNYHDGLKEALRLIAQNGNLADSIAEIKEELAKAIPTKPMDAKNWPTSKLEPQTVAETIDWAKEAGFRAVHALNDELVILIPLDPQEDKVYGKPCISERAYKAIGRIHSSAPDTKGPRQGIDLMKSREVGKSALRNIPAVTQGEPGRVRIVNYPVSYWNGREGIVTQTLVTGMKIIETEHVGEVGIPAKYVEPAQPSPVVQTPSRFCEHGIAIGSCGFCLTFPAEPLAPVVPVGETKRYPANYSPEAGEWVPHGTKMKWQCCDCALVHDVEFRLAEDGQFQVRMFRK